MNKIIIDGYNVIFRVPELRAQVERSLEHARILLIQKIKSYLATHRVEVTVVFDGTQPPLGVENEHFGRNLIVKFSRSPFKADPMIKERIRREANPKAMTLVTDDSDIIRFAKSRSVQGMSCARFYHLLTKHQEAGRDDAQKDRELSEEELAEWLRLFGKDKPGNG